MIYESSVKIPRQKPTRLFLLCPVGRVGAGKTTVLVPLAERLELARVCGDEIRHILHDQGYGYDRAFEILTAVATKLMRAGYSIALDSDCASPEMRTFIADAAARYGAAIVWVHVNPPEEFILNKLRNFKHTWLFTSGEQAVENYFARKPLHATLDMPFAYVFDTSRANLSEQINEAVNRIDAMILGMH